MYGSYSVCVRSTSCSLSVLFSVLTGPAIVSALTVPWISRVDGYYSCPQGSNVLGGVWHQEIEYMRMFDKGSHSNLHSSELRPRTTELTELENYVLSGRPLSRYGSDSPDSDGRGRCYCCCLMLCWMKLVAEVLLAVANGEARCWRATRRATCAWP